MTALLESGAARLDRWRAGPDPTALAALLGEAAHEARLERVHFPGGRPVQLVYGVTLRSGLVATILAEDCPGDPEESAAKAVGSLRKSRSGQRAALARQPVVADRAAGLVLRRAGLDERIPGLRLLHDKAFAREVAERLNGQAGPGPVATRLMAHRLGKRAVVRIDIGEGRIFARLRAIKSRDGEDRLARHRAVWTALARNAALAVPEPLGALPEIGVSLYARLPGRPARFDRDHGAIARSLAALRGLGLSDLPIHSGADEAAILTGWHERSRTFLPDLAHSIAPALERVCGDLEASAAMPLPCHRDLHEKQILVQGRTTGLLDFDTLSLADPALDPGNLRAHLCLAGLDERPLARALGGGDVALWRRAALLRLAMIHAFTATPPATIRRALKEACP